MKLFQITDLATKRPVTGLYFSDKRTAKTKRRELNGDLEQSNRLRYVVSPGPDHHNFNRTEK